MCGVGAARADLDQLDDAIPPAFVSTCSTLKYLPGLSGGLNLTVKVPHYSALRSGFTVRCGLAAPDSGYLQSPSDTKTTSSQ